MKAMVLLVLALLGGVAVLALSPSVRARAEAALFARDEPRQQAGQPDPPSAGSGRLVMADRLRGSAQSAESAVESATSGIARLLPGAAPAATAPAAGPVSRPVSPAGSTTFTPKQQAVGTPAEPQAPSPAPVQANQRIALPPGLARVWFGMTREQIEDMYATAWTKQQGGELTLVHYPSPDKTQMVRFVFAQDSLCRIEVRFMAGPGETIGDVCDELRERYAAMYPNVAERSSARWSDGVLKLEVRNATTAAEVRYTPAAAAG
jgi:hypothetical protein